MPKVFCKKERINVPFDYISMAEKAEDMLKMSLDALVNLDLDTAFKVLTMDDEVDDMHREIHNAVKRLMVSEPNRVDIYLNLLLISRHIERIGDHATNIAEEVIYLIEGEIIRHGRWDQPGTNN